MFPLNVVFKLSPKLLATFIRRCFCRPLNENDLTELPVGIFDSLSLLNFLYVLAKKNGALLFARKRAVK